MRGEASFLAAGGEKCSCPCAAAGGATSGAARGGAGPRAGRGPGRGAPRPARRPDPLRERRGAGTGWRKRRNHGAGGRRGKVSKVPPPCPPTAPAAVSPRWRAGGRERGASVSPRRAGCGASCPSLRARGPALGRRTGRWGGGRAGTRALGSEGNLRAGLPRRVRSVDAHLDPGRLRRGGGAAPGSQGSGKETQC